jgi:hypothetical protein
MAVTIRNMSSTVVCRSSTTAVRYPVGLHSIGLIFCFYKNRYKSSSSRVGGWEGGGVGEIGRGERGNRKREPGIEEGGEGGRRKERRGDQK